MWPNTKSLGPSLRAVHGVAGALADIPDVQPIRGLVTVCGSLELGVGVGEVGRDGEWFSGGRQVASETADEVLNDHFREKGG